MQCKAGAFGLALNEELSRRLWLGVKRRAERAALAWREMKSRAGGFGWAVDAALNEVEGER